MRSAASSELVEHCDVRERAVRVVVAPVRVRIGSRRRDVLIVAMARHLRRGQRVRRFAACRSGGVRRTGPDQESAS